MRCPPAAPSRRSPHGGALGTALSGALNTARAPQLPTWPPPSSSLTVPPRPARQVHAGSAAALARAAGGR